MAGLRSWARALLGILAVLPAEGRYMNCGPGVPLCGVLALESGFGRNYYRHKEPVVHGLWPQVGNYGSSKCMPPRSDGPTRMVYSCYRTEGDRRHTLWFEGHEWAKHGRCAGAVDEDDFFAQVCALSSRPLQLMEDARSGGFEAMVSALRRAGYPVFAVDTHNDQIELSACAGMDGRWKLAPVGRFPEVCGAGAAPAPKPTPPAVGGDVCVPNRRGPRCHSDSQCSGIPGCSRCAHSGYCTSTPLYSEAAEATLLTVAVPAPLTAGGAVLAAGCWVAVLAAGGLLAAAVQLRLERSGATAALLDDQYLTI
uniref:Uncharacterized protein n=1 Tax=Pyrodinium bahamense TaxID=73915 RepID=A0A7R9ZXE7_9DINO